MGEPHFEQDLDENLMLDLDLLLRRCSEASVPDVKQVT
jgi:hypothetical protein